MDTTRHIPVLLNETIDGLHLINGSVVIDATLGGGSHSLEILKRILPDGMLFSLDTDKKAIRRFMNRIDSIEWAKEAFDQGKLKVIHKNFSELSTLRDEIGDIEISGIMADLGFSSDQMDYAERGLSFSQEGPLDMRLDQDNDSGMTAEFIVNEYSEEQLRKLLHDYSDERFARGIAHAICEVRKESRIRTTSDLASVIEKAVPSKYRFGKIHPATKTFQALRMEVNRELEVLEVFLEQAIKMLKVGGRIAIISFHSGEDSIVKRVFRENARGCICPASFPVCQCGKYPILKLLNKKVIVPSDSELEDNPRSRSAKLRIAEKVA